MAKPGNKRKPPTKSAETELLVTCRRKCCLCYFLRDDRNEKAGQIAHLNGDPSNSTLDNLVWLCLDHHDRFDSRTSQSKNLTPAEVRIYRDKLIEELGAAPKAPSIDPREVLVTYRTRFQQAYSHKVEGLIDFACLRDGNNELASGISKAIANGVNTLLIGPSGCGKSLASYMAGLEAVEIGGIPIIVRAKDFTGNLRHALDLEIRSLLNQDFESLLTASATSGNRPLIIVDGFNECSESERDRLITSITTEASTMQATVLISAQDRLKNVDSLSLEVVEITAPTPDLKKALAEQSAGGKVLSQSVITLLDVAQTAVEAILLGEIGKELSDSASRFAAFDSYARKKMAPFEMEGVRVLSAIAGHLGHAIAFSMSTREADRAIQDIKDGVMGLSVALDAGLLVRRGDRISFGHELYLNAYGAEAIVRTAGSDATKILAAIKSPRHQSKQSLIVGAIEAEDLLEQVLKEIDLYELLSDCLAGACGQAAKLWTSRRAKELLGRAAREAASVEIAADDEGHPVFVPSSIVNWSPQDLSMFAAIADRLRKGEFLEEVLEIVATLDRNLAPQLQQLKAVGAPESSNLLFRELYAFGHQVGVGIIVRSLQPSFRVAEPGALEQMAPLLMQEGLTSGQIFTLLRVYHSCGKDSRWFAAIVPQLLARHWPRAPYHLKLELLDSARYCPPNEDEIRLEIIRALEALPQPMHLFISTAWVDTMSYLGAFEQEEEAHVAIVREELRTCLERPDSPDVQAQCYGIWMCQMDHPYNAAYYEAVRELSREDQCAFLSMAAAGARDGMFVGSLLEEIGRLEDPSLDAAIRGWTQLPDRESPMPQDVVQAFVIAHATLGWLGCTPPSVVTEGDVDTAQAMIACGELLYWVNRRDINAAERTQACVAPLAVLNNTALGVSADALWLIRNSILLRDGPGNQNGPITCVVEAFPNEAVEIFRDCLSHPEIQRSYFSRKVDWDRNQRMQFGMQVLGEFGNLSDLGLLRSYAEDVELGACATSAIQRIKGKFHGEIDR